MTFQIPAKIEAVFGSRTRAKVLGYLADSSVPRTGYAISKELGIGVSKVYEELKKLESSGILGSSLDVRGSKRFLLKDEDLRRFLLKNLRILSSDDWFSRERVAQRQENLQRSEQISVNLGAVPKGAGTLRFANEFRRPPEKDRALRRVRDAERRRR